MTASTLHNGLALCPAFQSGQCRSSSCSLEHKCATVLRSGRVCAVGILRQSASTNHGGAGRENRTGAAEPVIAVADVPRPSSIVDLRPALPRKRPVPSSSSSARPTSSVSAAARQLEVVDLEAPPSAGSGSQPVPLLGPLPTPPNQHLFGGISMHCMGKDPQQRGGLVLRAHLFQFEVVNSRPRKSQFQAIFGVVQQSLRAGEGVLFHCMAGRHKAARAASVMKALLQGCLLAQAKISLDQDRGLQALAAGRIAGELGSHYSARWMSIASCASPDQVRGYSGVAPARSG